MKIFTLSSNHLAAYFAPRQRQDDEWIERGGVRALPSIRRGLDAVFESILSTSHQFLPSEAGSILLQSSDAEHPSLVFAACYGERAEHLISKEVPADSGVVGLVYRSAQPYLSGSPPQDPHFYSGIDATIGFSTENLLCVPIFLEDEVCGVLELLNRRGGPFAPRDLDLMTVFASYISSSLQNALDARFAHELAKLDELSGLFNDRYFHQITYELVADALEQESPLSMVFLDLDAFKGVNDHHGHLAGAAVLSEVGHLIGDILPEHAVAARYGGDEYVVVWPRASEEQARELAEAILDRIRSHTYLTQAHWLDAPILHLSGMISASIGVAELPALGLHACIHPRTAKNHLIRAADSAMYAAKAQGKGCVVVAKA